MKFISILQPRRQINTKTIGDQAEDLALKYLQKQGLILLQRNYKSSGRGGGEIDLIMREKDNTLIFIEVRQRQTHIYGGAVGSITPHKQERIIFAARHYMLRFAQPPPCRFDIVYLQNKEVGWLKAGFTSDNTY